MCSKAEHVVLESSEMYIGLEPAIGDDADLSAEGALQKAAETLGLGLGPEVSTTTGPLVHLEIATIRAALSELV